MYIASSVQVCNPDDSIDSIDYIKNFHLEEEYEKQKARFAKEGKEPKEMLLFHGTAVANVDSILKENFKLGNQDKEKRSVFGEGIYFSEMPAVSLMYGNGLILCKVLLGNCETFKPQPGRDQPEIPSHFESREVLARDGTRVIHLVKSPSQILPYCVIRLKNEALSSEVHKPGHQQR